MCIVYTGPPGPPQNLRVENVTSNSCTLVWEPPSVVDGCEINGYYVERSSEYHSRVVKENSGSRSQFTTTKRDQSSQFCYETRQTYDDLKQDTKYECRVIAENELGRGTPSEPITFVVGSSQEPGKPGTPMVTVITMDSLAIEWESPAINGGTEITHYVVEARYALVLLDRGYY